MLHHSYRRCGGMVISNYEKEYSEDVLGFWHFSPSTPPYNGVTIIQLHKCNPWPCTIRMLCHAISVVKLSWCTYNLKLLPNAYLLDSDIFIRHL